MKLKKSDLKRIIKEELDDVMSSLDKHDASRREHLGDAIHDVMWEAVSNYMREMGVPDADIIRMEASVDNKLNEVAVDISHQMGGYKGFADDEMLEGDLDEYDLEKMARYDPSAASQLAQQSTAAGSDPAAEKAKQFRMARQKEKAAQASGQEEKPDWLMEGGLDPDAIVEAVLKKLSKK